MQSRHYTRIHVRRTNPSIPKSKPASQLCSHEAFLNRNTAEQTNASPILRFWHPEFLQLQIIRNPCFFLAQTIWFTHRIRHQLFDVFRRQGCDVKAPAFYNPALLITMVKDRPCHAGEGPYGSEMRFWEDFRNYGFSKTL